MQGRIHELDKKFSVIERLDVEYSMAADGMASNQKNLVCQNEEFGPYSVRDTGCLHVYKEEMESRTKVFFLGSFSNSLTRKYQKIILVPMLSYFKNILFLLFFSYVVSVQHTVLQWFLPV